VIAVPLGGVLEGVGVDKAGVRRHLPHVDTLGAKTVTIRGHFIPRLHKRGKDEAGGKGEKTAGIERAGKGKGAGERVIQHMWAEQSSVLTAQVGRAAVWSRWAEQQCRVKEGKARRARDAPSTAPNASLLHQIQPQE